MKYKIFILILFVASIAQAQVGIGQENPSAALEIKGDPTGQPTLYLNPESVPVGVETGQLAVIGDKLYNYDASRGKWLSIEMSLLNFGLAGPSDGQDLEYVGDVELSGPKMPFKGTIVYVTMNATGGQSNKKINLYKNGVLMPNDVDPAVDGVIEMVGYNFINNTYNLDFDAGDYFQVKVDGSGSSVNDVAVLLKVKWRQDNP
jgi:hypothetical protein